MAISELIDGVKLRYTSRTCINCTMYAFLLKNGIHIDLKSIPWEGV